MTTGCIENEHEALLLTRGVFFSKCICCNSDWSIPSIIATFCSYLDVLSTL